MADMFVQLDRGFPPYTLGEAVTELRKYSESTKSSNWKNRSVRQNLSSLQREVSAQSRFLGSRLASTYFPLLEQLKVSNARADIIAAAKRFEDLWHSESSIIDAFRDLCDRAKFPNVTSEPLRELTAVVASQIGTAANGSFSVLRTAAEALASSDEDLVWMRNLPHSARFAEPQRLELAEQDLLRSPVGHVVVWFSYYRAALRGMRSTLGPIIFLDAKWALPNALGDGSMEFPERAELQAISDDASWLENLHEEAKMAGSRAVLVRVDLGCRELAGAHEDARRQLEAILSVAVEAGGSAWQSSGTFSVLLNGQVRYSTFGAQLRNEPVTDYFGMGATAEVLSDVSHQLGDVLERKQLPQPLIEAFTALREARLSDHRDVFFQGIRPTTPRVATALEDHAMELIASVLGVEPLELAQALQTRFTVNRMGRRVAAQIMSPFDNPLNGEKIELRRDLQTRITSSESEDYTVSIPKVVELKAEILSLPLSKLQRSDCEEAFAVCTDPNFEKELLVEIGCGADLLRKRLRRVRNAVNHGLPLGSATLASIRGYANETSSAALDIALTWFKHEISGPTLLEREEAVWNERMARIDGGESWSSYLSRVQFSGQNCGTHQG